MEYLPEGPTITVPTDRYNYGVHDAVRGHNQINLGSWEEDHANNTTTFVLGPCVVKQINLTKARKIARFWGNGFSVMLNETSKPIIKRYMLLDGQRLVIAESKGQPPLLFSDSHATYDDELWLKKFPEEVWV